MKSLFSVIPLAVFVAMPLHSQDVGPEYDEIRHESVIFYKRKMILEVSNKEIKEVPKWDGLDVNKLPIKSEEAIKKAAAFMKELGYKDEEFYLVEISMIKTDQLKGLGDWYWKVVFGDAYLHGGHPTVVTIPVLLDGKIPKPKYEKLEQNE